MNETPDNYPEFEEGFDDFEDLDDLDQVDARGFMMRHPILLILVIVGASFMGYKTWPRASFYFTEMTDCGNLSDRPHLRQTAPDTLPELQHNTYCTLDGTVNLMHALATAKKDGGQPGSEGGRLETMQELAGVKYYVKLSGEPVFAILPADRKDVHHHRVRQSSLFGYQVRESGRLFDPAIEPGAQATARYLRLNFGIPDNQHIMLFDVTQHPSDRWGFLVILVLMGLTVCLATFGLIRVLMKRSSSES